jgi:hypothetical protein
MHERKSCQLLEKSCGEFLGFWVFVSLPNVCGLSFIFLAMAHHDCIMLAKAVKRVLAFKL